MTVCPFDKVPRNACIERKCNECGVNAIDNHYAPLKQDHKEDLLKYNIWEMVERITKKTNKPCSVTDLVTKQFKLQDAIDGLTNALEKFSDCLAACST